MFYLHTSNQLENLAIQYARIISEPLKSILEPELLVVQNSGMARYLSMYIADTSGISANTQSLFPAEFMWKLLRIVTPDVAKQSGCSPDALCFHIMQELSENPQDYPELAHYISNSSTGNDSNEIARWNLANVLSQLFDQYLFYRGDWIRDWEAGKADKDNWQARLWQRCVKDKELKHWLSLQDEFKHRLDATDVSAFPERISFFSMSSLSPGYLDLLGELGKKTDVHIYIMNPCEDVFWGDIYSRKALAKLPIEVQAYTDVGNPLLASMGRQGRDFIDQLLNIPNIEKQSIKHDAPAKKTLLTQLQNDIYQLLEPQKNTLKKDSSICFNVCHTAMREVEVLHDQILNALDSDSELAPSDIVVMMPDIERYAPYIEAIFSSPIDIINSDKSSKSGNKNSNKKLNKLPFSIADRNPLNAFNIIEAMNKVLLLSDTRFDVESVFELLDYDEIRQQFNLSNNQVIECRNLAKATNIRWGIDANYRKQNQLPNTDEHTWKYALDRLLLGYAIGDIDGDTDNSTQAFFKTKTELPLLAYTDIEGSTALMLADLKRFTDTLFRIHTWNHQNDTVGNWIKKNKQFISQLFAENSDYQLVLKALDNVNSTATLAGFEKEISFTTFQKLLSNTFGKISGSEKYLGYGITFCALVPMRSVPFKLVVLMGMNDGEFPRQDKHHSFDLMAKQARHGDRSRRDEDRYLFLESILAARSRLIISYIGQSIQNNDSLPPSVLVNELLDTLAVYTGSETQDLTTKHPLQAFSPHYFSENVNDSTLYSYANEYIKLYAEDTVTPSSRFISETLPQLDDEFKTVSLDTLIKFYLNPARTFLQRRFSIQTYDDDITLPIREPFEVEPFKEREIRELLMSDTDEANLLSRAKGLLPYGEIGDVLYNNEKQIIESFQAELAKIDTKLEEETLHFSLHLGAFLLQANISHTHPPTSGEFNSATRIRRITQVSAPYFSNFIDLWLTHLALNLQEKSCTEFYSPEQSFSLAPISSADAEEKLLALLKYYWQGLHFPLNFFPKSGFAIYKGSSSEEVNEKLKDATTAWEGGNQRAGEKDKFENWLLYRDFEMNDEEPDRTFMEVSQLIFRDMVENLTNH